MAHDFLPILVMLLLAAAVALGLLAASHFFGPKRPTPAKLAPYECGIFPTTSARVRFPVKFYMTALLFVIFDIEIMFLFPWAVILRDLKGYGLAAMGIFFVFLTIGFVYEWMLGALNWE